MRRRGTDGLRRRQPRACGRTARRRRGDAQGRACTQPRGRMPGRSVREGRSCRQASSGAVRRCRGPKCRHMPGWVLDSLRARCANAGAKGAAPGWQPTAAGLEVSRPTDAAPRAPPKRKVRKFDSLSAATKGPTRTNLALVLDGRQSESESGSRGAHLRRVRCQGREMRSFALPDRRRRARGRNRGFGAGRSGDAARESIACSRCSCVEFRCRACRVNLFAALSCRLNSGICIGRFASCSRATWSREARRR